MRIFAGNRTEMATYQLTLDRRTVVGRAIGNFLEELNCVDGGVAVLDERKAFNRSLVKFLEDNKIIEADKTDNIAKAVSKKFFENRKRTGELTDTELMLLNSKINASRLLANNEI